MQSTTIIITFPASLNFIIYTWNIYYKMNNEMLKKGFQLPDDECFNRFKSIWEDHLVKINNMGISNLDGLCMARPEEQLRSLFPPTYAGEQEFYRSWIFFESWWRFARLAYDYAVQPFLNTLHKRYGVSDTERYILITYNTLPVGFCNQYDRAIVLPFENLFSRNA
ncbi:hypothetical protein C7445_105104 [Alicyclobacillus sacchari]|uniref:Uncharacterized protein n=1 Tax=Alicyclobacillus sacchari TaxID=392010 RepID=A0A4R8LR14_9BACL|nr:hypothetical protein [Alicyclobacillus sacchari]TDY47925.1 hypothetical protein C7445_105104 [Alicyclobacillus sacchari]GMA56032.1 hypothetical protein GCM10025858_05350 [Alicyclobacillus sacchari]